MFVHPADLFGALSECSDLGSLAAHANGASAEQGAGRPAMILKDRAGARERLFGVLLLAAPADTRFDELVDIAVEDGRWIARLVLGAEILDHLVRV